jgi:signal transduction histidine kinase
MAKGVERLRFRIFADDFSHRLCASLGAEEVLRVEKWLCAARVVLVLYSNLWAHLGTSEFNHQPWQVQALLKTYLIYSFLAPIFPRLHGAPDSAYLVTTLAVDLFFAFILTTFTGGPESPFGPLWVFVIVTTAYLWGLRQTNIIATTCALLLLGEVALVRSWPRYSEELGKTEFRIERLFLRGTFLIVISLLFGYLVIRERRLRAESALVARVLGHAQAGSRMNLALQALFAEITPLYGARKALVLLREGNLEEIFSWELERPLRKPFAGTIRSVLQFSKLEAAIFSCPADTWYFAPSSVQLGRASCSLAFDFSGRRVDFDSKRWDSSLPSNEVASLTVSTFSFGDGLQGRLVLLDSALRSGRKEALRFLQTLLKQIGPPIQSIYLLRDSRRKVEDQVRARLSRELHDGILQSLLSTEMQLEVLRKQRSTPGGELERKLAALQVLIHREALNLRDVIEKTKPLDFSPEELPDLLAELVAKFRLETGISARLETAEENRPLPSNISHEIVRIVQEGLSNIRKHSRANNVVVTLCEGNEGQRKLLIADDGQGFEFRGRVTLPQLDALHRGPGVIKERVRLIGGQLTIDSSPGNWARLEITIPDQSHG